MFSNLEEYQRNLFQLRFWMKLHCKREMTFVQSVRKQVKHAYFEMDSGRLLLNLDQMYTLSYDFVFPLLPPPDFHFPLFCSHFLGIVNTIAFWQEIKFDIEVQMNQKMNIRYLIVFVRLKMHVMCRNVRAHVFVLYSFAMLISHQSQQLVSFL